MDPANALQGFKRNLCSQEKGIERRRQGVGKPGRHKVHNVQSVTKSDFCFCPCMSRVLTESNASSNNVGMNKMVQSSSGYLIWRNAKLVLQFAPCCYPNA